MNSKTGGYIYLLVLAGIACLVILSLVVKYFFTEDIPEVLQQKIRQQQNPFVMHKDSAALVWQRAKYFLDEHKAVTGGGEHRETDTMLLIPYYNSYEKGSSVRIVKRATGDSVWFKINCWYSREEEEEGGKEIALFMQTGIERYSFGK